MRADFICIRAEQHRFVGLHPEKNHFTDGCILSGFELHREIDAKTGAAIAFRSLVL